MRVNDYESALICACLLGQARVIREVKPIASPADFTDRDKAELYATVLVLESRGDPADATSILGELRQRGSWDRCVLLLSELLDSFGGQPSSARYYAEQIATRARLTRVSNQALMVSSAAENNDAEATDASIELLLEASRAGGVGGGVVEVPQDMIAHPEGYTGHWEEGRERSGIRLGISWLDHMTSGLNPGQLVIVAARTSVGKTAFAVHASISAMQSGLRVCFFSLEMTKEEVTWRALSRIGGIDSKVLERGGLTGELMSRAVRAGGELSSMRFFVDDSTEATVEAIAAVAHRPEIRPDLVVIDYLQMLGSREKQENRTREVSIQTRALKLFAKDIGAPVLLLSQLSRPTDKRDSRRPVLSDLRDSGSIEQDADMVIFIHDSGRLSGKPEELEKVELIVAKQRNGPVGKTEMRYRREVGAFEEWR